MPARSCSRLGLLRRGARSSPVVVEELSIKNDDNAIPACVLAALNVHLEIDGAHNTVAEFFVDQFLYRRSVNVEGLIKPVESGVGGHLFLERSPVRLHLQRLH